MTRNAYLLSLALVLSGLPACSRNDARAHEQDRILDSEAPLVFSPADATSEPIDATAPPPRKTKAYRGAIEHLFFHPLVIHPEVAFDGDRYAKRFDAYFVTASEFRAIVRSLYAHNYVLVGLDRVKQPLYLPEGKKPVVLSIDDVNYYPYMAENGTASRLVLDGKEEVKALLESDAGRVLSEDEVIPILDSFVREHPDFSDQGAKATLAVTGYKGLFGYHTEPGAPDLTTSGARTLAKAVADRLKQTGWLFASHGFAHRDAVALSAKEIEADLALWKEHVEPIVGRTEIYVYPFGSAPFPGTANYKTITSAGFTLLCEIGIFPYLQRDGDSDVFRMGRRHIDGIALREEHRNLLPFFDTQHVIDPARKRTPDHGEDRSRRLGRPNADR